MAASTKVSERKSELTPEMDARNAEFGEPREEGYTSTNRALATTLSE